AHFLKYFDWYTQEIGQFSSFLFHFPWSKILISGPVADDVALSDDVTPWTEQDHAIMSRTASGAV
ncbi:hypothetical protein Tco_1298403, partial [Tanacetum coccineum]